MFRVIIWVLGALARMVILVSVHFGSKKMWHKFLPIRNKIFFQLKQKNVQPTEAYSGLALSLQSITLQWDLLPATWQPQLLSFSTNDDEKFWEQCSLN